MLSPIIYALVYIKSRTCLYLSRSVSNVIKIIFQVFFHLPILIEFADKENYINNAQLRANVINNGRRIIVNDFGFWYVVGYTGGWQSWRNDILILIDSSGCTLYLYEKFCIKFDTSIYQLMASGLWWLK